MITYYAETSIDWVGKNEDDMTLIETESDYFLVSAKDDKDAMEKIFKKSINRFENNFKDFIIKSFKIDDFYITTEDAML